MSRSMFVIAQGQQESAIDPYDLFSPLLHWRQPPLPTPLNRWLRTVWRRLHHTLLGEEDRCWSQRGAADPTDVGKLEK